MPVRVHAGARRTAICGEHDGAVRVDVAAAPEKGKANRAVSQLLAQTLNVSSSSIELLAGATSPRKRLLVVGVTLAEAEARLAAAMPR